MQVSIGRQLGLQPTTVANFFMNARRRLNDRWDGNPPSPLPPSPDPPPPGGSNLDLLEPLAQQFQDQQQVIVGEQQQQQQLDANSLVEHVISGVDLPDDQAGNPDHCDMSAQEQQQQQQQQQQHPTQYSLTTL